jgi:hypothetical protein
MPTDSPSTETKISLIPTSSGDVRLTVIVATAFDAGVTRMTLAPVAPPGGR